MTKFLYNKITINIWQETILYPNRTHRHLKNPYKAHKYRLCRDLPICSRPTKNHPLVHPKIDLPGREKPILFPFS